MVGKELEHGVALRDRGVYFPVVQGVLIPERLNVKLHQHRRDLSCQHLPSNSYLYHTLKLLIR